MYTVTSKNLINICLIPKKNEINIQQHKGNIFREIQYQKLAPPPHIKGEGGGLDYQVQISNQGFFVLFNVFFMENSLIWNLKCSLYSTLLYKFDDYLIFFIRNTNILNPILCIIYKKGSLVFITSFWANCFLFYLLLLDKRAFDFVTSLINLIILLDLLSSYFNNILQKIFLANHFSSTMLKTDIFLYFQLTVLIIRNFVDVLYIFCLAY